MALKRVATLMQEINTLPLYLIQICFEKEIHWKRENDTRYEHTRQTSFIEFVHEQ